MQFQLNLLPTLNLSSLLLTWVFTAWNCEKFSLSYRWQHLPFQFSFSIDSVRFGFNFNFRKHTFCYRLEDTFWYVWSKQGCIHHECACSQTCLFKFRLCVVWHKRDKWNENINNHSIFFKAFFFEFIFVFKMLLWILSLSFSYFGISLSLSSFATKKKKSINKRNSLWDYS